MKNSELPLNANEQDNPPLPTTLKDSLRGLFVILGVFLTTVVQLHLLTIIPFLFNYDFLYPHLGQTPSGVKAIPHNGQRSIVFVT